MTHGNGHIVFKSGTTEVEVQKVRLLKNETIIKQLRSDSDLGHEVSIFSLGNRHLLQFRYNLFKQGSSTIAKYKEVYAYNDSWVKFRFYAGIYFKDIDGNEADYFLTIKKMHWDTPDLKDVLILTFESKKSIDFDANVLPENVLVDSDGMVLTDSDGNYLTDSD